MAQDRSSGLVALSLIFAAAAPAAGQTAAPDGAPAAGDIVVTGARKTSTATKTDTPLIETPQAISVIPRELLELRNTQRIKEALALTAGVQVDKYGADTRFDQVQIRGFSSTEFGDYRDGLRQPSFGVVYFRNEPYGLESIEVLKGPSSVLFGQNAPGGLVNLQSKRPTDAQVNEFALDFGSFGRKQAKVDVGGRIDDDGAISYRLVALSRQSGTYLPGRDSPDDRLYVAPSIRFRLGERTTLTVAGEYLRDNNVGQPSFFTLPNGTASNVRTYDPNFDRFRPTQEQIGYSFEHRFSDALSFRQNLRYSRADLRYQLVGAYALEADGRTIDRFADDIVGRTRTLAVDNQLQYRQSFGGVEARLLAGVDYLRLNGFLSDNETLAVPSLDLLNPVYGVTIPRPLPFLFSETERDRQIGGYFQGQFKYGGWILTGGGRYDHATSATTIFGATTRNEDNKFTYRVALARLFDNGLAPYVSYGTSFQLTPGTNSAGQAFRPTTGRQIEAGVKYSPRGLPGFVTASVFQIKQQNVLTQDPANVAFSVQTGEIRSRGIELEATLRPLPGLNLQASYTYLDLKVVKSNLPVELGNAPPATPKNQASALADYSFRSGALNGFGFGGDIRFQDRSWKDQANSQRNPSFTYVDAFAHYDIGPVRLAIRADNLFNRQGAICSFGFCYLQMPRDVIGSIRFRF